LLADDRGASTPLTFHGSGDDDRWRATLRAQAPIAPGTRRAAHDHAPGMPVIPVGRGRVNNPA
jgi:hypothetical protein